MSTTRRRGRPRGESGSRGRIVAAAEHEFGENGYDGATIRAIAGRAEVDSALVHHYFGTKADLFAEVVGIPLRPDVDVPAIVQGPRDEVGERVVRYVLEAFERPDVRRRGVTMIRVALGSKAMSPVLVGFLARELIGRITALLEVPDAALRATLVASQMAGLIVTRYVVRLQPIADAPIDELVARIGPTIQRYLFD
ncbi:TetR/AcrR family transcriptional regulator [Microbacterium sp. 22303]|uniref:TetR/AcrR family transcriptional regulator n=1 Tax=Microbacterium sp. 22303 TaxID=3453905 RepID=UPI003F83F743